MINIHLSLRDALKTWMVMSRVGGSSPCTSLYKELKKYYTTEQLFSLIEGSTIRINDRALEELLNEQSRRARVEN